MENKQKETLPAKWLEPTKSGKSLMDTLLERFSVMYPASQSFFITPERVQTWMKVWAEDFIKHGITPEDVKRGLEECTKQDSQYMPSLPQFINYCKPLVIPVMHQSLKIEQKMTPEDRKSGLEKLQIAKKQLFKKGENHE